MVLITIIEMHVEEEITNNHGRLKRFVPEPDNQDKVCISIRDGNSWNDLKD